jgi:phosphohistidine phosphatase SixA
MLADMIMGRQCHSQRTLRPTTTRTTNATTTTSTTVYGTEILDADYDDSRLDANANAVDPSDDDAYAYQVESSQMTPIRSNLNRNRPCLGRPRPRPRNQQQQPFVMVLLLSILVVAMLSMWHVVYIVPTNATTPTINTSRTTARLYNSYEYSQQQPMHLNFSTTYSMLSDSRSYDPHDSHQHNRHNHNNDKVTNNHNHNSDNGSNDKIRYIPKSLLLLRHAKSSWDDPSLRDFDRPLSPKGRQDAENLGKYLNNLLIDATNEKNLIREQQHHHHKHKYHNHEHKHHSAEQLQWLPLLPPDIIYVSPSVRTRATLELVFRHWKSLAGDGHKTIPVRLEQALYDFELDDGDSNSNTTYNTTSTNTYLDFVQHLDPIYQRVMIVGHNPALEQLEQQLAGGEQAQAAAKLKYPPGTFCELVFDNNNSNNNNESDNDYDVDNNVKAWNTIQAGQGQGKVTLFVTPKQTYFKV